MRRSARPRGLLRPQDVGDRADDESVVAGAAPPQWKVLRVAPVRESALRGISSGLTLLGMS